MKESQEPKYMIVDGEGNPLPEARIANRATGQAIPDEEPIMIFRAKDIHAPHVIGMYLGVCNNPGHREAVFRRAEQFSNFHGSNIDRVKEPD
jgi:hypothetical protein